MLHVKTAPRKHEFDDNLSSCDDVRVVGQSFETKNRKRKFAESVI
jgi:hypothetical protein